MDKRNMHIWKTRGRPRVIASTVLVATFAAALATANAFAAGAPSSSAQTSNQTSAPSGQGQINQALVQEGLQIFKSTADCQFCHGWDGGGNSNEYGGNAPSLRKITLKQDQIEQIVKCGIPGQGMPHHDPNAYTKGDKCYGLTKADLGAGQMPPKPLGSLTSQQIKAVAYYVATQLEGKGPATHQECVNFFGKDTAVCKFF
jgi:mono/diheme cytochrome c family protein